MVPICDDLTDAKDDDVFAPSTPTHPKAGHVTWQQSPVYDDGLYTVPLTSTFLSFPFHPKPTSSPTLECKQQHVCSPSEGVFNLSMDEDNTSSTLSDDSTKLKANYDLPRCHISLAASMPLGSKRDFWATSKFQNLPSPDVLPVPASKGQAALH